MAIKYIPLNKNEIQIYKHERIKKEVKRNELTDNALIALRRVNLFYQKKDVNFKNKIVSFNEYLKKQETKKIFEIINYFIADIN